MTDVSALPPDWQEYFKSLEHDVDVLKKAHSGPANERPWWAPDAQGFLAAAIVTMTFSALIIRMFHSSVMEDKMLDTMITILFSTCLVTVYNYSFGSSRGSAAKDETQNKVVEKMMTVPPVPPVVVAPVAPLQTLATPLPTTTGTDVTSVSGTTAPEDKKP